MSCLEVNMTQDDTIGNKVVYEQYLNEQKENKKLEMEKVNNILIEVSALVYNESKQKLYNSLNKYELVDQIRLQNDLYKLLIAIEEPNLLLDCMDSISIAYEKYIKKQDDKYKKKADKINEKHKEKSKQIYWRHEFFGK